MPFHRTRVNKIIKVYFTNWANTSFFWDEEKVRAFAGSFTIKHVFSLEFVVKISQVFDKRLTYYFLYFSIC